MRTRPSSDSGTWRVQRRIAGTPAVARRWSAGLTAEGEEGTHEKIFSHVGRSGVVDFERNRFGTEPDAAEQRQLRCRNVWSENNASG